MLRRFSLICLFALVSLAHGQERIRDVIYAKAGGAAFTMDVFKPKTPNGAAIIFLVSGGWFSSHEQINAELAQGLNTAGFTVFEVVHGSQPKYTIPEIGRQITRAVRFVHANAATYGVDENRLGLCGASAGGHLSLITAGRADDGDPAAKDPVDRASSRVAAVVAYFPPTDFLNYGAAGVVPVNEGSLAIFRPAFGIPPNSTPQQVSDIARATSPIYTINPKFPPTLLIHGDADPLVPIQQSESFRDALLKAGGVVELMVVKGGKHDQTTLTAGAPRLAAWFLEKLKKP
ncbi:MAG: alpha/beta hydrolase fold domain-containing protein [Fimbriimonas sp.]